MAEMVRYGLLANPYTPGVLIDFYGNPVNVSNSWPNVNGSGAGNLVALTATTDTVGYILHDRGSGGILLDNTGTGDLRILGGSTAQGIDINDQSVNGIVVSCPNGPLQFFAPQLGYFGHAPAPQQTSAGTLAGLIAALVNYGLISS